MHTKYSGTQLAYSDQFPKKCLQLTAWTSSRSACQVSRLKPSLSPLISFGALGFCSFFSLCKHRHWIEIVQARLCRSKLMKNLTMVITPMTVVIYITFIVYLVYIMISIFLSFIYFLYLIIFNLTRGGSRSARGLYTSSTKGGLFSKSNRFKTFWESCQLSPEGTFYTNSAPSFPGHQATAGRALAIAVGCGLSTREDGPWLCNQ